MTEEIKKAAWNLSEQIIYLIGGLLDRATKSCLRGNHKDYYFSLRQIKRLVVQELNDSEYEEMKKLESEMMVKTKDQSAIRPDKIEEYHECLMEILDKYGYLIQKREDSKKMF